MLIEEILRFIFPERCIGCGREGTALCAICERTITMKPHALSKSTAVLFDYHHPLVKKAIWSLKYHRRRSLGRYFGTALYREFFKQLGRGGKRITEEIILIPVPASKKAISMRGYNHAAVIADTIARSGAQDGLTLTVLTDALYKAQENERQVAARSRVEREKNVEDIFALRGGNRITGKTVVLIDDVITTGATVRAARRALKSASPKRVLTIGVAH